VQIRCLIVDDNRPFLDAARTISEPAWRSKPSWYLIATEDRMIPPPAQREMSARAGSTVVEVAGSHAIYVSKPAAVAELIETAVNATAGVGVGA
jgi:pimeloyl-ACP methyl ester carboxylesterase